MNKPIMSKELNWHFIMLKAKDKGYNQASLSRGLGMENSYLSNLKMSPDREVKPNIFKFMSLLLGVEEKDLFLPDDPVSNIAITNSDNEKELSAICRGILSLVEQNAKIITLLSTLNVDSSKIGINLQSIKNDYGNMLNVLESIKSNTNNINAKGKAIQEELKAFRDELR